MFLRILLQKVLQLAHVIEEAIVSHKTIVGTIARLRLLLKAVVAVSS